MVGQRFLLSQQSGPNSPEAVFGARSRKGASLQFRIRGCQGLPPSARALAMASAPQPRLAKAMP
eukprot:15434865-Alexandrium_andersonii.AAC.2